MLVVHGGKTSHAMGIIFALIMHDVLEMTSKQDFYLPPGNWTH
jgi:hypothetical protein